MESRTSFSQTSEKWIVVAFAVIQVGRAYRFVIVLPQSPCIQARFDTLTWTPGLRDT